ncbi:hypothetical protein BDV41DRAFT_537604 [Aspergillus transmontanensis]|uniref:Uncharacterized protein n=1 Tax=Aspergillus transmontanensis TaxID=1034304 RepID=A0A5N6VWV9_9EURO|nr:hypothetical protein BDV41DRAFT_537604 [Aspergillus transmontanensis]
MGTSSKSYLGMISMSVCQCFILLNLSISDEILTLVNVINNVVVLYHVLHLYGLALQGNSIYRMLSIHPVILHWNMPLICGTTEFTHSCVIVPIAELLIIAIDSCYLGSRENSSTPKQISRLEYHGC